MTSGPSSTVSSSSRSIPALTPLVIGHGRPFPYISNLSLSLGVILRDPDQDTEVVARVKVPKELLRRFLPLGDGNTFVPLEDVIAGHLDALFPGMEVLDHALFRVTRDTDYDVSDEADDMLQAVEEEVRRRRFGEVVRLEIESRMNTRLRERLVDSLQIAENQVYEEDGLLGIDDLMDIAEVPGSTSFATRPSPASPSPAFRARTARSPTSWGRCARATFSSITPTTRSRRRSSRSSARRSTTPTCSRSSRRSTARAPTRRSSRS